MRMYIHMHVSALVHTRVFKNLCCLSVRTVCIEVCICTRIDAKVRVGEGLHQSEST